MEEEKNKVHVTDITSCQNAQCCEAVKSNLPTERKRMHKFTKVASEKEKNKVHVTDITMINVMKQGKITYHLSISECTSSRKYQLSGGREKQSSCY